LLAQTGQQDFEEAFVTLAFADGVAGESDTAVGAGS